MRACGARDADIVVPGDSGSQVWTPMRTLIGSASCQAWPPARTERRLRIHRILRAPNATKNESPRSRLQARTAQGLPLRARCACARLRSDRRQRAQQPRRTPMSLIRKVTVPEGRIVVTASGWVRLAEPSMRLHAAGHHGCISPTTSLRRRGRLRNPLHQCNSEILVSGGAQ